LKAKPLPGLADLIRLAASKQAAPDWTLLRT
jgi:hypothetical protein